MDSKASQVAAVSQTPAQLVAANSGTSGHKRKRTVVLAGYRNFEWRKWKALVAANSGTAGHKRKRTVVLTGDRNFVLGIKELLYWQKWKARHPLPPKPREREEAASVTCENYRDGTPIQWAFWIVLNDDLCFENEEAARVYYQDFLKKVFGSYGSAIRIFLCYHDFFNAFAVGLTKAEAAILEVRDEVEYVRNLHIFISTPRYSAPNPSALLDANKDLVENSNSGKDEKCKAKMDSKDEELGLLPEAKENKDLAENSCPGKEEKYKTKMVTEDDKPHPLLRSKLFLVGLNDIPFEEEVQDELEEYNMDTDELKLLCHKRFVKRVFGRLASELKMVRSYSSLLNAFVVEVKDTVALTLRERFTKLEEVAFVRDLKRK